MRIRVTLSTATGLDLHLEIDDVVKKVEKEGPSLDLHLEVEKENLAHHLEIDTEDQGLEVLVHPEGDLDLFRRPREKDRVHRLGRVGGDRALDHLHVTAITEIPDHDLGRSIVIIESITAHQRTRDVISLVPDLAPLQNIHLSQRKVVVGLIDQDLVIKVADSMRNVLKFLKINIIQAKIIQLVLKREVN